MSNAAQSTRMRLSSFDAYLRRKPKCHTSDAGTALDIRPSLNQYPELPDQPFLR